MLSTTEVNGTGDFTGQALLAIYSNTNNYSRITNELAIKSYDQRHPEGYVLVTPFIQFWNSSIDEITKNKRAVVAYTPIGRHHDMEISRKRGILYVNSWDSHFGHKFYDAEQGYAEYPIKTGDKVRVVSDGIKGSVFRLGSRSKK